MTEQDKKELELLMVRTFNAGLEQVVMPVLNEVLETVKDMEQDISDTKETVERIEQVQNREIARADKNERRIDGHDRDIADLKARLAT